MSVSGQASPVTVCDRVRSLAVYEFHAVPLEVRAHAHEAGAALAPFPSQPESGRSGGDVLSADTFSFGTALFYSLHSTIQSTYAGEHDPGGHVHLVNHATGCEQRVVDLSGEPEFTEQVSRAVLMPLPRSHGQAPFPSRIPKVVIVMLRCRAAGPGRAELTDTGVARAAPRSAPAWPRPHQPKCADRMRRPADQPKSACAAATRATGNGSTDRPDMSAQRRLRRSAIVVQNGGSRAKNSETLLTKGDLPRPGGRNSRIPAIFAEHRPGPALLRTGNGYRLPASGGRVAAGEHFRVTGCRESR